MAAAAFEHIPIVDVGGLTNGDRPSPELAEELCSVGHEVGFMLVVGHGVPERLHDATYDMMRRFFSLPVEQKRLIDKRASRHFRGWEPVGTEYTNNRPDIREQIDCWSEWPASAPDAEPEYLRLLGPNQWLPDDVLAGHEALSNEWSGQLGVLAGRLLAAMWQGLGLPAADLERFIGDRPMSLTKFIHYPATPPGGAGVNAHHDTGFLTVLSPGSSPGLQVQNQAGDWIDVPLLPGSFVVNLGESLQAMTGNYLVATPHRVMSSTERYSTAHFYGPSLEAPLAPLPLEGRFVAAVAASPHHADAGFMARKEETDAGVGDMASDYRPATYGEQLWNYFARSYPEIVAHHYG
ncbi:MAG: isopenicillin N synthase family oxygenase [Acidimicrobiia bacterium]|nr:isopenicillin N synthase family oxygenase [Acidimicrobiia bacterium]